MKFYDPNPTSPKSDNGEVGRVFNKNENPVSEKEKNMDIQIAAQNLDNLIATSRLTRPERDALEQSLRFLIEQSQKSVVVEDVKDENIEEEA